MIVAYHKHLPPKFWDDRCLATRPLSPGARVHDLGCGAGALTATIAGLVPDGHVVGL